MSYSIPEGILFDRQYNWICIILEMLDIGILLKYFISTDTKISET